MTIPNSFSIESVKSNRLPTIVLLLVLALALLAPQVSLATGWTPTGSLATARAEHSATLLPNSQVLVAGGQTSNYEPLPSAELYNSEGSCPGIFELLLLE